MLNKAKPVTISCPEGFSYVGWNRCIAVQGKTNVSKEIAEQMNSHMDRRELNPNEFKDSRSPIYYGKAKAITNENDCFFSEVDEAFGLEDLAAVIAKSLEIEVFAESDGGTTLQND